MSIRFIAEGGQPHDTELCESQLNLLAHAQVIELEIGSRCGGHGVCGGDRVRIIDAAAQALLSPITESEREHLTDTELRVGWRLACQAFPIQDHCEIEIQCVRKSSSADAKD